MTSLNIVAGRAWVIHLLEAFLAHGAFRIDSEPILTFLDMGSRWARLLE